MDYGLVEGEEGRGIGGGLGTSQDGVDDPQADLDKAEAHGGQTVVPVTEAPGVVTFALFRDPQGNHVGVVKSES